MQNKVVKLMGRKVGMTVIFDKNGGVVPCTVIHMEPNVICQIKTKEKDGYEALQFGYRKVTGKDLKKIESKVKKGPFGHFKKAGTEARKYLKESRLKDGVDGYAVGQEMGVTFFEEGSFLDVQGISKGKGYQGVMKLHGFRGGPAAHGSGFHRHAGSTGMRTTPGRCFPGGKRASRMGFDRKTIQGVRLMVVNEEKQILLVKGSVPGSKGALVYVSKAIKKS